MLRMWGKGLLSESVHLTSPHSIFSLLSSPPPITTGINCMAKGLQSLRKKPKRPAYVPGSSVPTRRLLCPPNLKCASLPLTHNTPNFSSNLETDKNHSIRLLKDSHPSHWKKKASYTHKTKEGRCLKSASKSLVTLCWANCFEVIIVNETKWYQSYLLTFKKVSILFLVTKGQYIVWLKESSQSPKVSACTAIFF